MDGGVRSGVDIFKALALGARGVLIGRPWAGAGRRRGEGRRRPAEDVPGGASRRHGAERRHQDRADPAAPSRRRGQIQFNLKKERCATTPRGGTDERRAVSCADPGQLRRRGLFRRIRVPRRCISSRRWICVPRACARVLCLFEGVATGAADGDGAHAGQARHDPAAPRPRPRQRPREPAQRPTRLNAGRQRGRRPRDCSSQGMTRRSTSDIAGFARPVSSWSRTRAPRAKCGRRGGVRFRRPGRSRAALATLILPADTAWNPGRGRRGTARRHRAPATVGAEAIERVAPPAVSMAKRTALLMRGRASLAPDWRLRGGSGARRASACCATPCRRIQNSAPACGGRTHPLFRRVRSSRS